MGPYKSGASCDENAAAAEHLFTSSFSRRAFGAIRRANQAGLIGYLLREEARQCQAASSVRGVYDEIVAKLGSVHIEMSRSASGAAATRWRLGVLKRMSNVSPCPREQPSEPR
jgi:hypothetical protein